MSGGQRRCVGRKVQGASVNGRVVGDRHRPPRDSVAGRDREIMGHGDGRRGYERAVHGDRRVLVDDQVVKSGLVDPAYHQTGGHVGVQRARLRSDESDGPVVGQGRGGDGLVAVQDQVAAMGQSAVDRQVMLVHGQAGAGTDLQVGDLDIGRKYGLERDGRVAVVLVHRAYHRGVPVPRHHAQVPVVRVVPQAGRRLGAVRAVPLDLHTVEQPVGVVPPRLVVRRRTAHQGHARRCHIRRTVSITRSVVVLDVDITDVLHPGLVEGEPGRRPVQIAAQYQIDRGIIACQGQAVSDILLHRILERELAADRRGQLLGQVIESRAAVYRLVGPHQIDRAGTGGESGRVVPVAVDRHIDAVGIKGSGRVGEIAVNTGQMGGQPRRAGARMDQMVETVAGGRAGCDDLVGTGGRPGQPDRSAAGLVYRGALGRPAPVQGDGAGGGRKAPG